MTINLSTANEFIARHIGPRQADEQAMLATLGFDSLEGLSASVIPESIKGTSVLNLPAGQSEADALASIKAIAADHHARLRIHYGTDTPDPKFADPHARLEQRARQLARRHDVAVVAARQGTGDVVADALAATAGADLLVMDRRAHFNWGRLLRGSPWARVLRGSRCPVLIVQNAPKSAYRHVLVAVDFSETAGALVRYAGGLQGEARLELYHAIDRRNEAKLRSAEASMQAIQAYRAEVREQARQKMLPLATALDTRRNRVASVLGAGDPARQLAVQHEASGADLIAVGYQRRPAPVDWLMGSVAVRLVGHVQCDVLVFPRDYALREGRTTARNCAVSGLSA